MDLQTIGSLFIILGGEVIGDATFFGSIFWGKEKVQLMKREKGS